MQDSCVYVCVAFMCLSSSSTNVGKCEAQSEMCETVVSFFFFKLQSTHIKISYADICWYCNFAGSHRGKAAVDQTSLIVY